MSESEQSIDFLDVDTPIPGQGFAVLSFISPEGVLKKKESYFNSEFLKWLCDQSEFLDNVVLKGDKTRLNYDAVKEKYDDFIYLNEERLENEFHQLENFKTTVRGLKVRGVYSTQYEAEVRAKVLQKIYKRDNIHIGPVGYWLPWDPSTDRIERVEYLEPELNTLMGRYRENCQKRDVHYQEMKEENIRKAQEQAHAPKEMFEEEDAWLQRKNKD